jgi:hypothetical protein
MENFDMGSSDCTHLSGVSYIAIRHPLGRDVDILQTDTGQIVQTIELDGVEEVCWSANSCHLAVLLHVQENFTAPSRNVSRRSSQVSYINPGNEAAAKLRKIDESRVINSEKYEIRVYSCNESSTLIPPEWNLWKTISAPLYSYDFISSFSYHHVSFSFPLVTLSVTLMPLSTDDSKTIDSSKVADGTVIGPMQQHKVVLLDVNVCVYDEVLLVLPDGRNDSNSSSGEKKLLD